MRGAADGHCLPSVCCRASSQYLLRVSSQERGLTASDYLNWRTIDSKHKLELELVRLGRTGAILQSSPNPLHRSIRDRDSGMSGIHENFVK